MPPLEPSEPRPSSISSTTIPDLTNKIIRPDNHWGYCDAGGFGDVYRCRCLGEDGIKEVAVKVFRFSFPVNGSEDERDREKAARMIRRELGIWSRLNHRNIVPFLGITYGFGRQPEEDASLVSLWMPHGTLHAFLMAHADRLGVAHRLQLLLDIANGLHYREFTLRPPPTSLVVTVHSSSVVHGDLTSNNVLVDHSFNACLTDFGSASLLGELPSGFTYLKMNTFQPGTIRWAAPEHFLLGEEQAKRTSKSDIYSFGHMVLLVLSGKFPWSEIQNDIAVISYLSQGHKPSRPLERPIDDRHWMLIERCWSVISERPLAEDLVATLQQFLGICLPVLPLSHFLDTRLSSSSSLGSDNAISPLDASSPHSPVFECYYTADACVEFMPPDPIIELLGRTSGEVRSVQDCLIPQSSKYPRIQHNVVFIGESGTGKSSAINLLLKTGPFAPVSDDFKPCTQTSVYYETTFHGAKYGLWDTRGLCTDRNLFWRTPGEKDLKKFLKERHCKQEIDLLVFCIRGSRTTEASRSSYREFRVITRKLEAPVVVMVTHLEKEIKMEDWWNRNSARLEELKMEFDDHVCITALTCHPRLAESRDKLMQMITKSRRSRAEVSGFYFGSPVPIPRPTVTSALPRKAGILGRVFEAIGKANFTESHRRRPSTYSASPVPSTTGSYYTPANSPAASALSSLIIKRPTPRSVATAIDVPHINTNQLGPGDPPQLPGEETSGSGPFAQSMFHPGSSLSDHASCSDEYSESCIEKSEDLLRELPIMLPTTAVRRRKPWASKSGACGDLWECDLILGRSSRVVAVKAVRINTDGCKDIRSQQKELRGEFKIWAKLQHKNIVPLLGVVSDFEPLPSAVTPWFHNGSLSDFLARHEVSKSERHRLLGDIAIGLRHLHSQGVIHGGLHSDNVLIDGDGTACIVDFALSFISDFLGTSYLKSNICSGMQFADPALFRRAYISQDNVFCPTKACDIYSFGGLMLHVLSGRKPYNGILPPTLVMMLIDGKRPEIPTDDNRITPWHKSLIRMCWDTEECRRPSVDGLVSKFDRQ